MATRTLRHLVTVLTLNLISVSVALCQSTTISVSAPRGKATTWREAQDRLGPKDTVYLVTIAQPKHRHTCHIDSMSVDEIVCSHLGHTTTYRADDVAALIHPGSHTPWYLWGAGFLAAGGAATWGTVVLAGVCPPCAVATGIAALFLYWMAPASAFLTDGDYDDALVYLAPGQTLKVSLS